MTPEQTPRAFVADTYPSSPLLPGPTAPAEAFHERVVAEIVSLVDAAGSDDQLALRQAAARRGLTAIDVGLERRLGDVELGHVYEAVGRVDADLREVFGAGHGRLITAFGDEELRRRWLPRLETGALVGVAVTEPLGGSDVTALRCRAERDGDCWILSGCKGPMARVAEADAFVVFANSDDALTAFVVEADAAGLERRVGTIAGLGGWSFGELRLDRVRVGAEAVLGRPGAGGSIFRKHFGQWRAFMALVAIGSGRAALDLAADWAWSREVADLPLARVPAVVEKFGRNALALDLSYGVAREALAASPDAQPDLATGAKLAATDAAVDAVRFAIDVFGARGLLPDTGLEKRLRDLTALRIADGPNDVLAAHLGRAYLKRRRSAI